MEAARERAGARDSQSATCCFTAAAACSRRRLSFTPPCALPLPPCSALQATGGWQLHACTIQPASQQSRRSAGIMEDEGQAGLYCSTAGAYFESKDELAEHYRSDFHRQGLPASDC